MKTWMVICLAERMLSAPECIKIFATGTDESAAKIDAIVQLDNRGYLVHRIESVVALPEQSYSQIIKRSKNK